MPQLSRTPELFPHALDVGTDSLTLVGLTEADYAQASFLDARIRPPSTQTLPFAQAEAEVSQMGLEESCQFIFHIGHVGSTLLSRLLGRHSGVLALREPAILRTLAQIRAEPETFPRRWTDGRISCDSRSRTSRNGDPYPSGPLRRTPKRDHCACRRRARSDRFRVGVRRCAYGGLGAL